MSEQFEAEDEMSIESSEPIVVDQSTTEPSEPLPQREPEDREAQPSHVEFSTDLEGPSLASVIDVPLRVTVEIGAAKMRVREVLQLNKGSVVPLDRSSGDPADIFVNGRLIARGEVTVLEESLAVRIVELVGRDRNGGER